MNLYFEGDYRRKPQQNLAGASRTEGINHLIVKSQSGRKKRERERIILEKALIIQAAYRGYVCRKFWKDIFKDEFDARMLKLSTSDCTLDDLCFLVRRLALIFPSRHLFNQRKVFSGLRKKDANHFVLVIHHLWVLRDKLMEAMVMERCWIWRVVYSLNFSIQLLQHLLLGSENYIPVILKTTLYYTDVNNYPKNNDPVHIPLKIWTDLLKNDLFSCFVMLLDKLSFKPFFLEEVALSVNLHFKNLFKLINSPCDASFKHNALSCFAANFITPPLVKEVSSQILPNLAIMEDFPLLELGRVVINDELTIHPQTLFRFLYLDNDQKAISSKDQADYFHLLSRLFHQFSMVKSKHFSDGTPVEEDGILTIGEMIDAEQYKILNDSLVLLNSPSRTDIWMKYLDHLISIKDSENLLKFVTCLLYIWMAHRQPPYHNRIIKSVAFHRGFLNQLLLVIKGENRVNYFGNQAQRTPLLTLLSRGVMLTCQEANNIKPALIMFCFFLKHALAILNDEIFYKEDVHEGPEYVPFKLSEIREIAKLLKDVTIGVISLAFPTSPQVLESLSVENEIFTLYTWRILLDQLVSLLRLIHNRDSRRQFTDVGFWLIDSSLFDIPRNFIHIKNFEDIVPFSGCQRTFIHYEDRYLTVLRCLPFVIDFLKRFMLYQYLITELKSQYQNPALHFLQSNYALAAIRRDYIYEDAFEKLNVDEVPEVRIHVKIHLISSLGVEEPGIDGGGLFREFIIELLKTAFDPNRGFFLMNIDNELYPNPKISWIEANYHRHYFFIGRMLGKALYENVLVEIPLAEFFLDKLLGNQCDPYLNGLSSLDPDLYKNLMSLMNFRGDFSDLGLDFTTSIDVFGTNQAIQLKANGSNIPVTQDNVLEYIHLVAQFKINYQIVGQTKAFLEGLTSVIPQHWISMFSAKELQLIISGNESPIDIADLRENAVYAGGYSNSHPTILMFWQVLSAFNAVQKSLLLKFVTSCSRPPLLGFKELYPPFCIQFVEDENLLPSASTCMNILKLPNFQNEQIMQQKLLYAISSSSGFELI